MIRNERYRCLSLQGLTEQEKHTEIHAPGVLEMVPYLQLGYQVKEVLRLKNGSKIHLLLRH